MGNKDLYDILQEGISMPFTYFINPSKRTYWLYLISSLAMAYYVYITIQPKTSFLKYMTQKKIWWSNSAWVDYLMMAFNGLVKVLVIGPYLILSLYIGIYFNEYLINTLGYSSIELSKTQTLLLYTISITILNDLATYGIHYLMHKVPFLWQFHKVHHSATTLNPFTQYRIHPIELIINNARGIIVIGLCTGWMDYLSQHQISKIMFLGVNIFSFLFLFFGANLRHSHIPFKYPSWLEKFIISPFQHQIHHSNNPIHFNKNIGSKLAIWDRIFGTLVLSKNVEHIEFGLGEEDKDFKNFWQNLWNPFLKVFIQFKRLFTS